MKIISVLVAAPIAAVLPLALPGQSTGAPEPLARDPGEDPPESRASGNAGTAVALRTIKAGLVARAA
ncbi:hypothetical protein ABZ837_13720 [Streptomyces sp. NPDC047197]|uniref:hypothetical protein n=1 Tax=Streptomyces sp. NPDC047197 TaxID=3155477 RepID=UPI0033F965B5